MNPKDFISIESQPTSQKSQWTRRELLRHAAFAAAFLPQDFPGGWGRRGPRGFRRARTIDPAQIPTYKYRTLSVNRFPALQNEFNAARNNAQLGTHRMYRDQISTLGFKLPGDFPNAKSVVVVAAYSKNMYANFQLEGSSNRIMIPFHYYNDDMNAGVLKGIVEKEIIKTPGRRVVDISQSIPLKLLAARSGLGRYARNGLIFVDGMGSYSVLYAFLTDHTFTDDHWTDLQILYECNRCHACERTCPTRCISRWSYSVNIDRCLTLYNENPGDFPNWILGSMHHALMGCMRCKAPCPVNDGIADLSGNLENVSEEETRKILKGAPDEALLKSLQRKLRQFRAVASKDQFPIMSRNLRVLIRA